jgi:hypothetical protein
VVHNINSQQLQHLASNGEAAMKTIKGTKSFVARGEAWLDTECFESDDIPTDCSRSPSRELFSQNCCEKSSKELQPLAQVF